VVIDELLVKLLWHASINLRSNVVEYLLYNTKLKETLTIEEAQQILFRIGTKFHISHILHKDFPILSNVESARNEDRLCNLLVVIRLLHSKIPLIFDQKRILEQFPFTEENLEKLAQIARIWCRS